MTVVVIVMRFPLLQICEQTMAQEPQNHVECFTLSLTMGRGRRKTNVLVAVGQTLSAPVRLQLLCIVVPTDCRWCDWF